MKVQFLGNQTIYIQDDAYDSIVNAIDSEKKTVNVITELGVPATLVVSRILFFTK